MSILRLFLLVLNMTPTALASYRFARPLLQASGALAPGSSGVLAAWASSTPADRPVHAQEGSRYRHQQQLHADGGRCGGMIPPRPSQVLRPAPSLLSCSEEVRPTTTRPMIPLPAEKFERKTDHAYRTRFADEEDGSPINRSHPSEPSDLELRKKITAVAAQLTADAARGPREPRDLPASVRASLEEQLHNKPRREHPIREMGGKLVDLELRYPATAFRGKNGKWRFVAVESGSEEREASSDSSGGLPVEIMQQIEVHFPPQANAVVWRGTIMGVAFVDHVIPSLAESSMPSLEEQESLLTYVQSPTGLAREARSHFTMSVDFFGIDGEEYVVDTFGMNDGLAPSGVLNLLVDVLHGPYRTNRPPAQTSGATGSSIAVRGHQIEEYLSAPLRADCKAAGLVSPYGLGMLPEHARSDVIGLQRGMSRAVPVALTFAAWANLPVVRMKVELLVLQARRRNPENADRITLENILAGRASAGRGGGVPVMSIRGEYSRDPSTEQSGGMMMIESEYMGGMLTVDAVVELRGGGL